MIDLWGYSINLHPALAWLSTSGLRALLILVAIWVTLKVAKTILNNQLLQKLTIDHISAKEHAQKEARLKTINTAVFNTLRIVVWLIGLMMILSELGADIGPLMAGAGVAGIAIGFGARNLVADFLAGLFLLTEDQFTAGDMVAINNTKGFVEDFSLRKTVLRSLDGGLLHIPNGQIKVLHNFSRSEGRLTALVGVAYKTDLNKAIQVLEDLAKDFAKDKDFGPKLLEPPKVLGIEEFGSSSIDIKLFFQTKPREQWGVKRAFLKRVKSAFDKAGIEIPFPHRVIIQEKEG